MADEKIIEIREQPFQAVVDGADIMDLEVAFRGTRQECEKWAADKGLEWKPSRQMLYAGYWYLPPKDGEDNACYLPS